MKEWAEPESKEVVLERKGRESSCFPRLESKPQLLMGGHHRKTFRR
jgi:hypothetical protein